MWWIATLTLCLWVAGIEAQETVRRPFLGVTHITRAETSPRNLRMHIVLVDLTAPGIRIKVTPPGGPRETIRQTTLQFLEEERAQIAVNAHFFLPFPSANPFASLIGLAASDGVVYSAFEVAEQSFAIVANAPAINIDTQSRQRCSRAARRGRHGSDGTRHLVERGGRLGPDHHQRREDHSGVRGRATSAGVIDTWWTGGLFERPLLVRPLNARTVIGLANQQRTLILFTVDRGSGSLGMSLGEVADC